MNIGQTLKSSVKKMLVPRDPEVGYIEIDKMMRNMGATLLRSWQTDKNWHIVYFIKSATNK